MGNAPRDVNKNTTIWKILVAVLLVIVVILAVIAFNKGGDKPDSDTESTENSSSEVVKDTETESEETPKVDENDGSETFVIFGVDSRANNLGKGTRSDSIMLINVNHDLGQVRVSSIYRDTMVKIEGHGYEKITHAHSYGGPEFAMETINTNFDLNVESYATFNFITAADIIDEVGGLDMEITSAEAKYINTYITEVNGIRGTSSAYITEAGTYTLDGTQAVAYSRIRYTAGGDFKRAERQRDVLFALFQKVKTMSAMDRIAIAEEMMDEIKTNYSSDEMTSILYYLSKYEIVDMSAFPEVFYGGTVDGAYVEVPVTLVDMNKSLHEALLQETDYVPSQTVQEISDVLRGKVSGANHDMRSDEE